MSANVPVCYTIDSDDSMDHTSFPPPSMPIISQRTSFTPRLCVVCGSKAIGINFGAPTCAPCKAFFRRNARRKEVLTLACQHRHIVGSDGTTVDTTDQSIQYLQIRRCSSCRLHRCFQVGMKEELVRTEEENLRHKQLVDLNRKRRESLKQQQRENLLLIPSEIRTNQDLLNEQDWRHLANIVQAYDNHCLKTFLEQRATISADQASWMFSPDDSVVKTYIALPISFLLSISSFLRSLPAFHSLPHAHRTYLCKTNLRPLIIPNSYELNQCCFSDATQTQCEETAWTRMCGERLYQRLVLTRNLAQSKLIADPIVTRLWLVVLFFSSSLYTYYDPSNNKGKMKKSYSSTNIESAYVTLLWKYLLHRHGLADAVRIFSNLIHVFLQIIRVGIDINLRLRTERGHYTAHETLNQLVSLDINHV